MVAMVNGETGNHGVASAYLRQRPIEVVLDNGDVRGSRKALAGSLQHGGREAPTVSRLHTQGQALAGLPEAEFREACVRLQFCVESCQQRLDS